MGGHDRCGGRDRRGCRDWSDDVTNVGTSMSIVNAKGGPFLVITAREKLGSIINDLYSCYEQKLRFMTDLNTDRHP